MKVAIKATPPPARAAAAETHCGWATAISTGWPLTAGILRGLAGDYEHIARREDQRAEER